MTNARMEQKRNLKMSLFGVLLLILFFSPPLISQSIPQGQSKILHRTGKSIVGIRCKANGEDCFGTGIVVHQKGVILTTPSTVPPAGAKDIRVKTSEGVEYDANIVNVAEDKESVFLRVNAENLSPATFRNPDEVEVGDITFTFGNVERIFQRNEEFSISMGILSGKYNTADSDGFVPAKFGTTYHRGDIVYFPVTRNDVYSGPMLETTASTNQGNDGGALTDVNGNVIGLMTLSYSRHRWLGLAVPYDKLKEEIKSTIEDLGMTPPNKSALSDGSGDLKQLQKKYREVLETAKQITATVQIQPKKIEPSKSKQDELKKDWYYGPPSPFTGTIVSEDGFIIVNDDRMQARGEIKSISVILPDGTKKKAEQIQEVDELDLLLLKVDVNNLQPLADAKKDAFKTGTFVLAPGRPPEPDSVTLTEGIIVSPPRSNHSEFLVDAEINPGNLGGPIVSLDGKLLGVSVHPKRFRSNSKMCAAVTIQEIRNSFSSLK